MASARLLAQTPPPEKAWGRAVLENLALLGGLTVNYWIGVEYNKLDWDFGLTWADQSLRIFELRNLRFDSNAFEVNALHSVQGAFSYLLSRTNGLTPAESFLVGLASSAAWEYIAEFREMVSLNDMIVTPIAGLPVGEGLFEASRFLRRPGARDSDVSWPISSIPWAGWTVSWAEREEYEPPRPS